MARALHTAAFLGDLTSLARMLAADPGLAQAPDPAVDVLDITPVEHAVAGGQTGALRLILDHIAQPLPGGVRALRSAAAQGRLAMVERLLTYGADATRIGVGRWVLHPEIAPLLASRGAAIDSSGSWFGAACTGNQGRKDDPDYVRALLRHGARATDRRKGDHLKGATGVRALNATALHYAAKAGFLRTIDGAFPVVAQAGRHEVRIAGIHCGVAYFLSMQADERGHLPATRGGQPGGEVALANRVVCPDRPVQTQHGAVAGVGGRVDEDAFDSLEDDAAEQRRNRREAEHLICAGFRVEDRVLGGGCDPQWIARPQVLDEPEPRGNGV